MTTLFDFDLFIGEIEEFKEPSPSGTFNTEPDVLLEEAWVDILCRTEEIEENIFRFTRKHGVIVSCGESPSNRELHCEGVLIICHFDEDKLPKLDFIVENVRRMGGEVLPFKIGKIHKHWKSRPQPSSLEDFKESDHVSRDVLDSICKDMLVECNPLFENGGDPGTSVTISSFEIYNTSFSDDDPEYGEIWRFDVHITYFGESTPDRVEDFFRKLQDDSDFFSFPNAIWRFGEIDVYRVPSPEPEYLPEESADIVFPYRPFWIEQKFPSQRRDPDSPDYVRELPPFDELPEYCRFCREDYPNHPCVGENCRDFPLELVLSGVDRCARCGVAERPTVTMRCEFCEYRHRKERLSPREKYVAVLRMDSVGEKNRGKYPSEEEFLKALKEKRVAIWGNFDGVVVVFKEKTGPRTDCSRVVEEYRLVRRG